MHFKQFYHNKLHLKCFFFLIYRTGKDLFYKKFVNFYTAIINFVFIIFTLCL